MFLASFSGVDWRTCSKYNPLTGTADLERLSRQKGIVDQVQSGDVTVEEKNNKENVLERNDFTRPCLMADFHCFFLSMCVCGSFTLQS